MEANIRCANALILRAVESGDVAALAKALDDGADVNTRGQYRRTAAMKAAELGRSACLAILINAGADIEAVDEDGLTAVMFANRCPWRDGLYILMAAGCSLDMVLSREVKAEIERRAILAEIAASSKPNARSTLRL